MAREQARADGAAFALESKAGSAAPWRWLRYGAAAAVVVLAVGLVVQRWPQRDVTAPAFRATSVHAIRSLLPDGGALPRAAFRLRWTPGPPGTGYAIRVTDETLSPIADAAGLDAPEFQVPEAALGRLAPGASVLWQVQAVFPDGTHVSSDTFLEHVGPSQGP
jgi:hypothetical protein